MWVKNGIPERKVRGFFYAKKKGKEVKKMKTGAILYITGASPPGEGVEAGKLARDLGIHADRALLVSQTIGYENVIDAWWTLLTKGMKQVVCCVVSTQDGKTFLLNGEPLRLCG